jgi:hypothetical protein
MPKTYEPIATTTLNSAANSVEFTSISGSYTDLVLVAQPKGSSAQDVRCQVNSDTGSNYSTVILSMNSSGGGTSARRASQTSATVGFYQSGLGSTSGGPLIIQFQNYSNTTTYKTFLSRSGVGSVNSLDVCASSWRSTSSITSVKIIFNSSADFDSGSTFTLYGIKAA